MKKIYNIPVYKDAERLGAYLEGNLSEEDRLQLELEIQNDPELAELAKDDIPIDWNDDINEDYPDFDWQEDGNLVELLESSTYGEPNDPDDLYDEADDDNNFDDDEDDNDRTVGNSFDETENGDEEYINIETEDSGHCELDVDNETDDIPEDF